MPEGTLSSLKRVVMPSDESYEAAKQQFTDEKLINLTSTLSTSQFLEQRLGVFEVGGVEALGEPVVDL